MAPLVIEDRFLADHLLEDLRRRFGSRAAVADISKLESLVSSFLDKGVSASGSPGIPASLSTDDFEAMVNACADIYPILLKLLCKPLTHFDKSDFEVFGITPSVLDVLRRSKSMIKVLREGQDFAFQVASRPRRDNIVHQFQVFLLGYYLITMHRDFFISFLAWDIGRTPVGALGSKEESAVLYVWTLSSLFHDCGRGLQTYFDQHKELVKPGFSSIFNAYGLEMPASPTISKLMERSPDWRARKKTFFSLLKLIFTELRGIPLSIYTDEIEKPLRRLLKNADHAVISALLLIHPETFQRWEGLEKLKATIAGLPEDDSSRRFALRRYEAFLSDLVPYLMLTFCGAVAVAFHASVEFWFLSPFTQLLTICDNLQEWQRLTKVGDQVTKIIPCQQIGIVSRSDEHGAAAEITIDYENPATGSDSHYEVLLWRWDPEKKWGEFQRDIGKHGGEEIYTMLFKEGLKVKIQVYRGRLLREIELPER